MYNAHGSWIAIVVFGGMFALRALSSQRRRGRRYGGNPMSKSSFTSTDRRGPGGGAVAPPPHPVDSNRQVGTAAGWFRDPFFKHEQRYFSGTAWTEHVTDGDVPGIDPPPERPGPDARD
ncbi:MAG TPA: DUF2510 domain-containing protein [Acidimicrobiales bacterium]|jgi:hypothetical protein|nr:DUF2510 domain-containing protein [Acidimicrobiales bacterium]